MEIIDSVQNQRVKKWSQLSQKKYRDKEGLFLVEGEHLIQEAMKANVLKTILFKEDCPFAFSEKIQVSQSILDKLSSRTSSEKMIGICKIVPSDITNHHRLLLLDGVQDPGNLGTLIRTAISFGFDGIYISNQTCDIYNEKVVRSTQGAIFQIPIVRTDLSKLVQKLQQEQVMVVATSLQQAKPLNQMHFSKDVAVILGNEGQGVSHELLQQADDIVKIEMADFESLNVGVAGGILMYHLFLTR